MLRDLNLQGHGLPDRRLGDGALEVAGDAAMGQMEEEVEDKRRPLGLAAEEAIEQRDLRPTPGSEEAGGVPGSGLRGEAARLSGNLGHRRADAI